MQSIPQASLKLELLSFLLLEDISIHNLEIKIGQLQEIRGIAFYEKIHMKLFALCLEF